MSELKEKQSLGRRWIPVALILVVLISSSLWLWRSLHSTSIHTPQASVSQPPWEIRTDAQGHVMVMGLTLGQSTLRDARVLWSQSFKVGLYQQANQPLVLEGFSDNAQAGLITGKGVLTADIAPDALQALLNEASSKEPTISGATRYTLKPDAEEKVMGARIKRLTFIPSASLEVQTIEERFGKPEQRTTSAADETDYFFYPSRGLIVGRDRKGRVSLHYAPLNDYPAMRQLLAL